MPSRGIVRAGVALLAAMSASSRSGRGARLLLSTSSRFAVSTHLSVVSQVIGAIFYIYLDCICLEDQVRCLRSYLSWGDQNVGNSCHPVRRNEHYLLACILSPVKGVLNNQDRAGQKSCMFLDKFAAEE